MCDMGLFPVATASHNEPQRLRHPGYGHDNYASAGAAEVSTTGVVEVAVQRQQIDTGSTMTSNGRRRTLFGDILSAVVSSSSSSSSASALAATSSGGRSSFIRSCSADEPQRNSITGKTAGESGDRSRTSPIWPEARQVAGVRYTGDTLTPCAPATTNGGGGAGNSGMQQLSTSWEYLRPTLDIQDVAKDDQHDMAPPRFIEVQKGKISLGPVPVAKPAFEATKDTAVLEARIAELEDSLQRLQKRVNDTQCSSPTLEKDLRDQIETMNRSIKSKERRAMQVCREHKALQARFHKQESSLQCLSSENENLQQRVRQYECCLDDVMRKVVDALVAEDNLREEVTKLKNRVRDLEAQNAALSLSPSATSTLAAAAVGNQSAKVRGDEGYCTMSSGQPPPGSDAHLEDLPEEPEQMFVLPEPCSAELEEWSMSQEELGAALEEDANEADWLWNSSSFLNSTLESQSESISQLLENTIEYSEDEEIGCKDFTRDFYKLVNIASNSTRSLQSPSIQAPACPAEAAGLAEAGGHPSDSDTDSEDQPTSRRSAARRSPTPSEAGLAQVSSCSSSSSCSEASDDRLAMDDTASVCSVRVPVRPPPRVDSLLPSAVGAKVKAASVQQSQPPTIATAAKASGSSAAAATPLSRSRSGTGKLTAAAAAPASNGGGGGGGGRVLRPPRSSSNNGLHSFNGGSGSSTGGSGSRPTAAASSRTSAPTSPGRRSSSSSSGGDGQAHRLQSQPSMPTSHWRSTGWRLTNSQQHFTESAPASRMPTPKKDLKTPPPVPARRSNCS